MSAQHTPTPWKVDQYGTVNDPNGRVVMINGVASVCSPGDSQEEAKANAHFIVHAVNHHDALLEHLEWTEKFISRLAGECAQVVSIRAAIAKARGEVA